MAQRGKRWRTGHLPAVREAARPPLWCARTALRTTCPETNAHAFCEVVRPLAEAQLAPALRQRVQARWSSSLMLVPAYQNSDAYEAAPWGLTLNHIVPRVLEDDMVFRKGAHPTDGRAASPAVEVRPPHDRVQLVARCTTAGSVVHRGPCRRCDAFRGPETRRERFAGRDTSMVVAGRDGIIGERTFAFLQCHPWHASASDHAFE